jgi:hypothetical protein
VSYFNRYFAPSFFQQFIDMGVFKKKLPVQFVVFFIKSAAGDEDAMAIMYFFWFES